MQWTAGHDLRLLNDGLSPTCVRPQGDSIIDLTWVSPRLVCKINSWSVRSDIISFSDHLYVLFVIGPVRGDTPCTNARALPYPRWDTSRMDVDMFTQSIIWACAVGPAAEESADVEGLSAWLARVMTEACDSSASRVGVRPPRKTVYWWNENIADLRRNAIRARRRWMRKEELAGPKRGARPKL